MTMSQLLRRWKTADTALVFASVSSQQEGAGKDSERYSDVENITILTFVQM